MRLNENQIHKILIAHNEGMTRHAIAKRYNVDSSTVRFHVEKFEQIYGTTQAVYSLVKPAKKACEHPSLKCLICGTAQDHIRRKEKVQIQQLTRALDAANERLENHGYSAVEVGTV